MLRIRRAFGPSACRDPLLAVLLSKWFIFIPYRDTAAAETYPRPLVKLFGDPLGLHGSMFSIFGRPCAPSKKQRFFDTAQNP